MTIWHHICKVAKKYEKSSYDTTSSTVCNGKTKPSPTPSEGGNSGSSSSTSTKGNTTIVDACTNPDILRVIYFGRLIVDIVKIVIPIGLIIMGMIDFSKSIVTSSARRSYCKRFFCSKYSSP